MGVPGFSGGRVIWRSRGVEQMPRQKIREGDIFEISIENGEKAFGQILSIEPDALNSIGLALGAE